MCLVRVDGDAQLVAACLTRARAGMVVETASTEIESIRAGLLQMLARHYPKGAAGAAPDGHSTGSSSGTQSRAPGQRSRS